MSFVWYIRIWNKLAARAVNARVMFPPSSEALFTALVGSVRRFSFLRYSGLMIVLPITNARWQIKIRGQRKLHTHQWLLFSAETLRESWRLDNRLGRIHFSIKDKLQQSLLTVLSDWPSLWGLRLAFDRNVWPSLERFSAQSKSPVKLTITDHAAKKK